MFRIGGFLFGFVGSRVVVHWYLGFCNLMLESYSLEVIPGSWESLWLGFS